MATSPYYSGQGLHLSPHTTKASRKHPGPLMEAPAVPGDRLCSSTADTHTAADSQPQRG